MATFGELLQELRKDHRLSQKQLVDVIAVTTGTVSNYENNQHLPDIEKLIIVVFSALPTSECPTPAHGYAAPAPLR